ncbi:MAG TPA: MarR family transcriptional regulator [Arachidicoccus sp.]
MKSDNPYLKELEGMLTLYIHSISQIIDKLGSEMMKEKKMPIDMDQLPVLMCVFLGEHLSQQEIATYAKRDKSSVKRTLTVFEKKGLIKIVPHAEDKRKTIVQTTDAGNFIAEQVRQMTHDAEEKIFSFLTKKAKKELLVTLKDVLERIKSASC